MPDWTNRDPGWIHLAWAVIAALTVWIILELRGKDALWVVGTVGRLDAVKDQIGYMAQKFGLYGDLTVEENMVFYSDLFGIDRTARDTMMAEFLQMTRMAPFRGRPAAKLSGGMKQKLALMCTLLHKPRVLFLDEPTNGVDISTIII